ITQEPGWFPDVDVYPEPLKLSENLPSDYQQIVERCLDYDPIKRPKSSDLVISFIKLVNNS
ncbi:hypothetical protein C1645_830639, partial [Glomus cerebriforme]